MNTPTLEHQESPAQSPMRRAFNRAVMAISTATAALASGACTTYVYPVDYNGKSAAGQQTNTAPQQSGTGTGPVCETPEKLESLSNSPFTGYQGVASDIAQMAQGGMTSYASQQYSGKTPEGETMHGAQTLLQAKKKAVHGGNVLIDCQSFPAGPNITAKTVVWSKLKGMDDKGGFMDMNFPGARTANEVHQLMVEAAGIATQKGISSADAPFAIAETMKKTHPEALPPTWRAGTPGKRNGEYGKGEAFTNCQFINLECQQ